MILPIFIAIKTKDLARAYDLNFTQLLRLEAEFIYLLTYLFFWWKIGIESRV